MEGKRLLSVKDWRDREIHEKPVRSERLQKEEKRIENTCIF